MTHPVIALRVAAAGDVPAIDVGPSPEAVLFGHDRVVNHGPHHGSGGRVEARGEEHSGKNRVIQNLCEAAEVGILHDTGGRPVSQAQRRNLAIHRSVVARGDRRRDVARVRRWRNRGVRRNLERHAPHDGNEADRCLNDRFFVVRNAHGFPPAVGFHFLAQGSGDGALEVGAGDFLRGRASEAHDLGGRDAPPPGVVTRKLGGLRVAGIEENQSGRREAVARRSVGEREAEQRGQ